MPKVDAQAAHKLAVEVAARQIKRLAEKEVLSGWDGADLERYAGICKAYDEHELKWMSKLDPATLPEELVRRVLAADDEESAANERPKRSKRSAA